jgi:hypothetical protein
MESEAIDDMNAERRRVVDVRRPYTSTVRRKPVRAVRYATERCTRESVSKLLGNSCCSAECIG